MYGSYFRTFLRNFCVKSSIKVLRGKLFIKKIKVEIGQKCLKVNYITFDIFIGLSMFKDRAKLTKMKELILC